MEASVCWLLTCRIGCYAAAWGNCVTPDGHCRPGLSKTQSCLQMHQQRCVQLHH